MDGITTTVQRGHFGGLTAESRISLAGHGFDANRRLDITTSKGSRGGVRAIGNVVKVENGMVSFVLFQDYCKPIIEDKSIARATEKSIRDVHARALARLPEVLTEIRAHYKIEEATAVG